ncbi:MAG TPA: reverse transcriptase family protein, partial [Verrucomicrobiae bacterium]|nr:reverse transcriptase family protein [Verrucomicrobiae bacterium]
MNQESDVARNLASQLLAGDFEEAGMLARAHELLVAPRRGVLRLIKVIVARFAPGSRPPRRILERFILSEGRFHKLLQAEDFSLNCIPAPAPRMYPASGFHAPARPILHQGELANLLNVRFEELQWFADLRQLEPRATQDPLRHYKYLWKIKASGSVRLLEAPKQRLKALQRFLLKAVIDPIPPHSASHGFRSGHSILSFTAPHIQQSVVLKLDIKDFFPSIFRARILGIFLTAGYPEPVAGLLAGLCTNTTPLGIVAAAPVDQPVELRRLRDLYYRPHLPQGAPTSPALANLCCYRLDCRLAGLARSADANYSRYADDLL